MYELRTGDILFIEESPRPWRMYIDPILFSMRAVPEEVETRINDLETAYKEDLLLFFREKKSEDATLYTGEIQADFDEVWGEKHPEFFDVDKLFAGCGEEDLKKAEGAMAEAREVFSGTQGTVAQFQAE